MCWKVLSRSRWKKASVTSLKTEGSEKVLKKVFFDTDLLSNWVFGYSRWPVDTTRFHNTEYWLQSEIKKDKNTFIYYLVITKTIVHSHFLLCCCRRRRYCEGEGKERHSASHYVWFSQFWSQFYGIMYCLPQRLKSMFLKKIEHRVPKGNPEWRNLQAIKTHFFTFSSKTKITLSASLTSLVFIHKAELALSPTVWVSYGFGDLISYNHFLQKS